MTTKTETKKATLDTAELRDTLQKVNTIKPNRQLVALSYASVEFADGKATITANNLSEIVKVTIDSDNTDNFSILLPRKTTEKFLTGGNGRVSITQGNSQKMATLSRDGIGELNIATPLVSDFPPSRPMPDNLGWHTIDAKKLCSIMRIVATACATEESRPILTGVACNDGRIAAADGFRLHVYQDAMLVFGLGDKQAIIPLQTVVLMDRLFRKAETVDIAFEYKEDISLSGTKVYPNYVYLKSGNVLMLSQLIQGNYPQYEKLIPDKFDCKASFSTPLLGQRLSMIDPLIVHGGIVRYIFETDEQGKQVCSLSGGSEDEGRYFLTCPIKFEGKESKIAFNYKYIIEAIKPFSMCSLEITSPSSPGKITGDIEGLTITIMPMFVNWE